MMRVARRQLVSRSIMPVTLVVVCAIVSIVAFTLWQAREDARARAEREGENIGQAIEADVSRNIELYDLSLQGLREALRWFDVQRYGHLRRCSRISLTRNPEKIFREIIIASH